MYVCLLCDITFLLFVQYNTAQYVQYNTAQYVQYNTAQYVCLNARSGVTIGNGAYVDIAFLLKMAHIIAS